MSTNGYAGAQGPTTRTSQFNAMSFVIEQLLNVRNYTTLVKVLAVRNAGEVSEVGFVDVQIMINQIDGEGNAMPHGTVNNIPYMRLQGGTNAVIIDPQVGDIGMCCFADRDISAVKATRAVANPGSMRRADIADGLYMGGFLNAAPLQYIRFTAGGIEVVSPAKVTLKAPSIVLDGIVSMTSTATAATSVTAPLIEGTVQVKFAGKDATTHTHTGVRAGTDNSGGPT